MRVLEICRRLSVEVVLPEYEIEKYSLDAAAVGATVMPSLEDSGAELCIALGGDGTILRAFNHFNDLQTPVFGVNFGRVGFLSAVEPAAIDSGVEAVLNGESQVFDLSLIELTLHDERHLAFNDVVVHKPDGGSIIRLGYSIGEVDIGSLSCDGLVVATAAGSTAYNLATGGPLMSLGLDAMALTAIAPHSLCSRPLIASGSDRITVRNESVSATAAVYVDGRDSGGLDPGDRLMMALSGKKARLLQLAGANFYVKLRDKFIRPSG
ncbi:MAG: NAD(+)/NADH kinase [Thermoleophilia bacterium]